MNRPPTPLERTIPVNLASEPDFDLGRLSARPSICQVHLGGTAHNVERRVMQALVALAQARGHVVSRDELVSRCWGGRAVSDDAIQRCIAKVRKLGELDAEGSFSIETFPRIGYQLVEASCTDAKALLPGGSAAAPRPRSINFPRNFWLFAGAGTLVLGLAIVLLLSLRRPTTLQTPTPAASESAVAVVPAGNVADLPAGAVFKDCGEGCPEMVIVPSGYFSMGSTKSVTGALSGVTPGASDNEGPQHEVLIAKPFAVARYDTTREEYARFASDTARPDPPSCHTLLKSGLYIETVGASWRHPGFAQTPRDPVVCINWDDATAYAAWLSRKTSKPYRLLSEAEWEYAARSNAGETQSASPATQNECSSENGGDRAYQVRYPGDHFFDAACADGYSETSPVGSFPGNAFGLFDMKGNVWQWTQDCYHPSYDGAPNDGSAWLTGPCDQRVVRGGSWTDDLRSYRVTRRQVGAPADRYSSNGLRVARSL